MIREGKEFSPVTKARAVSRQKNKCASCGLQLTYIIEEGRMKYIKNQYGEGAHAHHMRHCQQGGSNSIDNCAIICRSCHYSAHGSNTRDRSSYLTTNSSDYEFFNG